MKDYVVRYTKQFRKDLRHLEKAGYDIQKLQNVISTLAEGEQLPERYRDHELKGPLRGTRECHIGPDWLLHYVKKEEILLLVMISTGDHRHVLGIE
jgi:mRNA interferase YafQ